jgi:UDP-glucose 4-epimerase
VNGGTTDGRCPFRENDELVPRGVHGLSKAEAETELRRLARDAAMKITVVRPPLVLDREQSTASGISLEQ